MNTSKKMDAYFWGSVLIWAGLVFWGDSVGMLPKVAQLGAWSWIFLGAAVISLGLNLYSLSSDAYQAPDTGDWIWSGIFLILGLGGLTSVDITWPLIIILIGAGMLVNSLVRRD